MKKLLFLPVIACYLLPVNSQEGYGNVDPGKQGLVIGSQTNYDYSALVVNGANQPYGENGKRDIVFKFESAGKSIIRSYRGGAWDTYMQFLTTNWDSHSSIAEVRMHIGADGNIGIGTTSPQSKLDVAGKIRAEGIKLIGKIGKDLAYPFSYKGIEMDNFSLTWLNDPEIPHKYGYALWMSASTMRFFTSQQPRLTIDVSGNVGIGTIIPQNKLDVNGTIRAKEIKVESNWADFVFDKGYRLPTLKEVEQHIIERGHLPNVPSEAEIKASGVSLGEANALLLQKIEELTLYTLQQQKLIDSIKEELEELKSNINR